MIQDLINVNNEERGERFQKYYNDLEAQRGKQEEKSTLRAEAGLPVSFELVQLAFKEKGGRGNSLLKFGRAVAKNKRDFIKDAIDVSTGKKSLFTPSLPEGVVGPLDSRNAYLSVTREAVGSRLDQGLGKFLEKADSYNPTEKAFSEAVSRVGDSLDGVARATGRGVVGVARSAGRGVVGVARSAGRGLAGLNQSTRMVVQDADIAIQRRLADPLRLGESSTFIRKPPGTAGAAVDAGAEVVAAVEPAEAAPVFAGIVNKGFGQSYADLRRVVKQKPFETEVSPLFPEKAITAEADSDVGGIIRSTVSGDTLQVLKGLTSTLFGVDIADADIPGLDLITDAATLVSGIATGIASIVQGKETPEAPPAPNSAMAETAALSL